MAYRDIDLSCLENRSILVVDDNHSIHRDYRAVLCPHDEDAEGSKLDEMEDLLFGAEARPSPAPNGKRPIRNFHLEPAYQGEEAYEMVKERHAAGLRFPLAFIDMRMPPGWDGLETIEKLREADPDMRYVIVTAYSDHTYETIVDRLGPQTLVQLVYKPFNPAEIYELAFKTLLDWEQTVGNGSKKKPL